MSGILAISVELRDGDDLLDVGDRIRESFVRAVAEGRDSGVVRDENGNTVGTWTATPEPEPETPTVRVSELRAGETVEDDDGRWSRVVSVEPALFGAFEILLENGETLFRTHASDEIEVRP